MGMRAAASDLRKSQVVSQPPLLEGPHQGPDAPPPRLGFARRIRLSRQPAWMFTMPTILILAAITVVPGLFLYYISLFDYNIGQPLSSRRWVGLENYWRLLSGEDSAFWPAVFTTLLFVAITVSATLVFGLILALALDRLRRGAGFFATLLIVPMVVTPVMAGLLWRLMFNNLLGVVNAFLAPFGLEQNWLGSPKIAILSVSIVEAWQWTPFVALILYAGLRALPEGPIEAAQLDGASGWKMLRFVLLPMLRPIMGLVIALRVIDGLKIFDTAFALTQGGPGNATETLGLRVFHTGLYQTGLIGRASAMAVMLLVLVTICFRYVGKYLNRAEEMKG